MLKRLKFYGPARPARWDRANLYAYLLGVRDGWQQPFELSFSTNVDHLDDAAGGWQQESLDRGINLGQWLRSPLNHQHQEG